VSSLHDWIELAAQAVEALAVVIMVVLILAGTARWLFQPGRLIGHAYEQYRVVLARSLQVGLELLVAADIIRTVMIEASLANLASLAGLVVVRTLLGWTLAVEVEGRWPWQREVEAAPGLIPSVTGERGAEKGMNET
jgi:uncharacterized membrane protein